MVYVGDALIDYEATKGAGIDFIGITTGLNSFKEFKDAGVHYILNNIDTLPSLIINNQ